MFLIAVTGSPYGNEFYLFQSEHDARHRAYHYIDNICGNEFANSHKREFEECDRAEIDNLVIEMEEINFE